MSQRALLAFGRGTMVVTSGYPPLLLVEALVIGTGVGFIKILRLRAC